MGWRGDTRENMAKPAHHITHSLEQEFFAMLQAANIVLRRIAFLPSCAAP